MSINNQLNSVRLLFFVLTIVMLSVPALAQTQTESQQFTVTEIIIEGNQQISEQNIVNTLGYSTDQVITTKQVKEGAKAVRKLGFFSEVSYKIEGRKTEAATVRYVVTEYPKIKQIKFTGNKLLQRDTLLKVVNNAGLKSGQIINASKFDEVKKNLKKKYQKKNYAIVAIGNIQPKEVLVIPIHVGKLAAMRVSGLSTVPRSAALQLINIPQGEPIKLSDLQRSYQQLQNSIYFTRVQPIPKRGYSPTEIILNWQLSERTLISEPVEIDTIQITGVTVFSPFRIPQFPRKVSQKSVNNYQLLQILQTLYSRYLNRGYTAVRFESQGVSDDTLTIKVLEGTIAEIEIEGNSTTIRPIITKQISLEPGDLFNIRKLQSSKRQLLQLGYFSKVSISQTRLSRGKLKLKFTLTEKKHLGSIKGSLSWSKSGLAGNLDLSRKNIFGLGEDLSLSFKRGLTASAPLTGNFSWKNRYYPLTYNYTDFSLYRRQKNIQTGSESIITQGVSFGLSYRLSDNLSLNPEYSLEYTISDEIADPRRPTHLFQLGVTYDTRLNPQFPSTGNYSTLNLIKAGGFAPGPDFAKLSGSTSHFFSISPPLFFDDYQQVIGIRLKSGLSVDVPIEYQTTLGGSSTIRGFGGKDSLTVDNYAFVNIEYRFLIIPYSRGIPSMLSVHAFADLGSSLGHPTINNWNMSVGAEVNARIFGPLRVGVAWPMTEELQLVPNFYFAMGTMF